MTPEQTEEVANLEVALDTLLTEIVARRDRFREPLRPQIIRASELQVLERTPVQWKTSVLTAAPIDYSMRMGVTLIGERLHEIGGVELMGEAMVRLEDRYPGAGIRYSVICDKRWDGIGDWHA